MIINPLLILKATVYIYFWLFYTFQQQRLIQTKKKMKNGNSNSTNKNINSSYIITLPLFILEATVFFTVLYVPSAASNTDKKKEK